MRGENIYLEKECPQHGSFRTILWRGSPAFSTWVRPKIPVSPQNPMNRVERGCPFDCGLCPDHRQQPCCVLFDVTLRCDLACSFCFASAGKHAASGDPSLETIRTWYQRLLDAGGPFNVQLSGGEPSLRDDLPEIIALGKSMGFPFFQINTNGLRLARDPAYLGRLKQAGLSTVYLQFDGTTDEIFQKMRGGKLLELKIQTIERCAEEGLGVVLVPTLVPGINFDNLGEILRLAIEHAPTVRGVHFQPVSYFGRYPQAPRDEDRITIPEVIRAIEAQSGGRIRRESFKPSGAENALCSFHGNFVIMPDGELKALTRHHPDPCCCTPPERADEGSRKSRLVTARNWSAPKLELSNGQSRSLGGWDDFLDRIQTHSFTISGMAFQDAWNLDLERLRDCYIMQASRDSGLVPFCAYNLTDQAGHALYRPV
ncbi:predicted Fe-S oxidoreductases [Longilinea arvoryzae]|uniref:Predicted Fe-S oxidoreductases n=2 Tax=Longilinea arvoryzae TaxID=360412 RepID=A0A0S7BHE9_9CHLR|nr:predicted Fe-S oxidoreductases [Longilinea arvoryzae]